MRNIDIALAPDNNYARHCAVVMASVVTNASYGSKITFYILDGGLSEENKSALKKIDAGETYDTKFLKIDEKDFADFPSMKYISVSTWYRLKISTLLPPDVGRILYLDCDVIVKKPLDELFDMPMDGCLVAGAVDNLWRRYSKSMGLPLSYHYFNAG